MPDELSSERITEKKASKLIDHEPAHIWHVAGHGLLPDGAHS